MDKKEIGETLRRKRKSEGWSQSHLGWKAGVSESTISKIEKGESVKPESLANVLLAAGMSHHLNRHRNEEKVFKFKTLSLEELRSCVSICRDMIREGGEISAEFASYKKLAEKEITERVRDLFKAAV